MIPGIDLLFFFFAVVTRQSLKFLILLSLAGSHGESNIEYRKCIEGIASCRVKGKRKRDGGRQVTTCRVAYTPVSECVHIAWP